MTEEEFFCLPDIPDSCPFTISRLLTPSGEASASWLIREHDQYGEYPHIYAKVCKSPRRRQEDDDGVGLEKQQPASHKVIILSDTGCATETRNTKLQRCDADGLNEIYSTPRGKPRRWNIRTFLEHTINPGDRTPYVVIATHCHYDHILGIGKLMMNPPPPPPARMRFCPKTRHMSQEELELHRLATTTRITVLTSSHDKSFVTPYSNLQRHSLSSSVGVHAPRYAITWAEDLSEVQWRFSESSGTSEDSVSVSAAAAAAAAPIPSISMSMSLSSRITVLHTPGHTPDSMSWYDADLALLCVGDSFYLKETHETRKAPWGPEPAMPTMFDVESDLADLWRSTARLLLFVRARNAELELELEREREREWEWEWERKEIEIETETKTKTKTEHLSNHCSGTLLRQPNNAKTRTRHDQAWNWNWNSPWKSTSRQDQTGFDHPHPHPQQDEQEVGRCLLLLPEASFQHARNRATENDVEDDDDDWILVDLVAQGPCSPSSPSSSSSSSSSRSSASSPPPQPPRVRLAAAHTTATRVDAEAAILSFREFILRILRDEVPKQRVHDGYRGEERWLFDFALASQALQEGQHQRDNTSTPEKSDIDIDIDIEIQNGNGNAHLRGGHRFQYLHRYSVLAPLQVIELGRSKIPRESWTSG
jgi:glyoxylase-like metal-dependent hydrolase (beta-lactamase superfamily II)